ncbi:protein RNA-directed DNA methylation 3 [Amaranthus tricolor]|uniref:protein RNA-directed DNA methylation 3 n=1 Tax=Amaranthus tricolor TaxID=29722 RepID=UPI00258E4CE5|nr:protein RNA-directed DNA methylation 3 [Amaranthus tricolor]
MASKGKGIAFDSSSGKRKRGDDDNAGDGKRKNRGVVQFFDDAAVEFDGDNDSDSDSDFFDDIDFIDDYYDSKVKREPGRYDNVPPFFPKEEELSGDELEKMLKERYRGSHVRYAEDDIDSKRSFDKDFIMPSAEPTIWKVKCKVGREKNTVFCLIQKYVDMSNLGTKLQIISAFAAEHVKGFVFVEAEKQSDVVAACHQLADVYYSLVTQVPSNEVAQLLVVRKRHSEVKEGTWARVKNGIYRGDLAQVVAVNNERKRATVKLIPRIDLQALTEKYGGGVSLKRTKGSIPAARLISSSDLEEFRPLIQYRRDRDTGKMFEFLDSLMLKDGFLYKKLSIDSLSFWGVNPSEDELQKFTVPSNDESDNVEWLSQLYGEQKKKSNVKMDKGGEKGSGKGEGSSGSHEQSSFEVNDLVHFGKRDFGMIIGLEKDDNYKILKEGSEGPVTLTLGQKDLKYVPVEKKFTALDHRMKTISINDTIKILDGPAKGRQGIVKQIYRGVIFLYDETELDNAYSCSKSQMCEKVRHCETACHGKDEGGPSSFEDDPSSPKSPLSPKKPWQMRENNFEEKEGMFSVGQSVRIRIGPLKGYMCRVLAIRYTDVTVKLDSQRKVLTVKREHLSEVRGQSSTSLIRDDPESSSPFKPFDLLGSEGNANDWLQQASGSADAGGWNVGGSSSERSAWPAFPSSAASLEVGTTATDPPSSVPNDNSKDEDNGWLSKVAAVNKSDAGGWGSSSGGWGKDKQPAGDQGGSWNAGGSSSKQDKANTIAVNSWGSQPAEKGQPDAWDKGKRSEDTGSFGGSGWGAQKSSTDQSTEKDSGVSWAEPKSTLAPAVDSWGKAAADGWGKKNDSKESSGWGSSLAASQSQTVASLETNAGWGQKQAQNSSEGTGAKDKNSEVPSEDPWGLVANKQGDKDNSKRNEWGSSSNKPTSDGNGWGSSSGSWKNSQEENAEVGKGFSGGWKSSEGGKDSWGQAKNFENDGGFNRGQGSSGRGRGRDHFGRGRGRGRGSSFDKGDDYQGWNKSNKDDVDGGWTSKKDSPQTSWQGASPGSSSWGQKDNDTQAGGSDDGWGKAANKSNNNQGASWGGGQGNNATEGWKNTTSDSGGWSKGGDASQGKSWGKDFGSEGGESWSKPGGNNSWNNDNDRGHGGFGGRRGRGFRGGRDQSGRGFRGGRGEFGRDGGGRSSGRDHYGGRSGGEGGSFNSRNNEGGSWGSRGWSSGGDGEDRSWKRQGESDSSWGGGSHGGSGEAKGWGKQSEGGSWGAGTDNKASGDNGGSKGWSNGGGWGGSKSDGDNSNGGKRWSSPNDGDGYRGGGWGGSKADGDSSNGGRGWSNRNEGDGYRGRGRGGCGGRGYRGRSSWGAGDEAEEKGGSKPSSSWGGGSGGGAGSWGKPSSDGGGGGSSSWGGGAGAGAGSWGKPTSDEGGGGAGGGVGSSWGSGAKAGAGSWGKPTSDEGGGGDSSWGGGAKAGAGSWRKPPSGDNTDAGGGGGGGSSWGNGAKTGGGSWGKPTSEEGDGAKAGASSWGKPPSGESNDARGGGGGSSWGSGDKAGAGSWGKPSSSGESSGAGAGSGGGAGSGSGTGSWGKPPSGENNDASSGGGGWGK